MQPPVSMDDAAVALGVSRRWLQGFLKGLPPCHLQAGHKKLFDEAALATIREAMRREAQKCHTRLPPQSRGGRRSTAYGERNSGATLTEMRMVEISEDIVRKAARAAYNLQFGAAPWEIEEPVRQDLECYLMRAALSAVAEDLVRGEREACAKIAECKFPRGSAPTYASENADVYIAQEAAAKFIAAAIRARSTKDMGEKSEDEGDIRVGELPEPGQSWWEREQAAKKPTSSDKQ